MSSRALVLALCALVPLAGCGSARPLPGADALAYLHVGVDPSHEARRTIASLARGGYVESHRIAGPGFVALAFRRRDGRATAVRIVTRLGVVLGLDGGEVEDPIGQAVGLLDPPGGRLDLDGDGRPEILLTVHGTRAGNVGTGPDPSDRTCIGIVRVVPRGRAFEVPVDAGSALDGRCVEEVRVPPGGGAPEALVVVREEALAYGDGVPTVSVPMEGRHGRWGPAPPRDAARFFAAERAARAQPLVDARRALDVPRAYRIAVELAAIAHFAAAGSSAQVRAFDGALRGLVLTSAEARVVARARDAIGLCARGGTC